MPDVFPSVQGKNLNKVSKTVPDDFTSQHLIAIVAFQQSHQRNVDETIEILEKNAFEEQFEIIEIPVIQKATRFRQIRLDALMRAAIRDHRIRDRTITVYLDKKEFMTSLGIETDGSIHWFVIHRNANTILLRGEGVITPNDLERIAATTDA
ncbi:MAG: hypothetical protein L7S46_02770 [Candidatus Poseidoniaceae archaeon]|nr:hypothetical protein [Candidatus Poseidoniaceae archaeon]